MMKVALTGGIASGKSTVLRIFQRLGAKVLDCDKIAKALTRRGKRGYKRIVEEFGSDILDEKGRIDRKKLAKIVFFDEEKRKKLNALIHPLVYEKLWERIKKMKEEIVIVDVPLLVESGGEKYFDKIIVVYAEPSVQLERLIKRGLSEEEARARMGAQASWEERLKVADFVIRGDVELVETEKNVKKIWENLKKCLHKKESCSNIKRKSSREVHPVCT
ncbi:dephospho-CoA kinase [bacterium]|nr:dephospho-CoA kinase [bacterium]